MSRSRSPETSPLDLEISFADQLELFLVFVVQNQSSDEAWKARFRASQLLPQVRVALATGDDDKRCVRDFNQLCGEAFLHEEEARLFESEKLRAWTCGLVDELDWSDAAVREVWGRYMKEREASRPAREAFEARWAERAI